MSIIQPEPDAVTPNDPRPGWRLEPRGTDPIGHEPPSLPKQVLTVPEAAEALGISRSLAYELVARNDIPAVRLGRRIVVPRQAINEILSSAFPAQSA